MDAIYYAPYIFLFPFVLAILVQAFGKKDRKKFSNKQSSGVAKKAVVYIFSNAAKLIRWAYCSAQQRFAARKVATEALIRIAPTSEDEERARQVITKTISERAVVKFHIFDKAVVPEVCVSCDQLKEKLGGETLKLGAISMPTFDLPSLMDVIVNSSDEVAELLESLAASSSKQASEPVRQRERKNKRRNRNRNHNEAEAQATVQQANGDATDANPPRNAPEVQKTPSKDDDAATKASGKVFGFGTDTRTLHKPTGPEQVDSYYVDLRLDDGSIDRRWGVDLERALKHAGAEVGDAVTVRHTGKVGKKKIYRIDVVEKANA